MPKTPSYRSRKGYSQALVTLTDSATGKRRDYWLGEAGSPASREGYHRLVAEWEANGRRWPVPAAGESAARPGGNVPVVELIGRYWRWAEQYYRPNESGTLKVALRLLKRYFGQTPAADFGPTKLRLLRDEMIRGDEASDPPRRPWSRVYVNQQVRRIRQLFRWGASHELLPAAVHQALAAIEPLKRGRSNAREGRLVGPADEALIDAVRPQVNRQVAAIMDLQLLTGARSGEILKLRSIDIDTSGKDGVWTFRPREHKTMHRGKDRVIYLGPAAQAVVRQFLVGRPLDQYLFSPAEAEAERRERVHSRRRTPKCCGNRIGTNRRQSPQREPGDHYTPASYARSLDYAFERAFPPAGPLARLEGETVAEWRARLTPAQRAELKSWRKAHRFHPHQLRHNAATNIRREFGLEAAQLALGHASGAVTDAVYAERDASRVVEVMRRIG